MSYVPPKELRQLLAVLADGELSEEQECRLAEILRRDPQARTYYLDSIALWTSLHWEYAAAGSDEASEPVPPFRSRRRLPFLVVAAAGLGSLAAVLLLALPLFRPPPPPAVVSAPEQAEPIDVNVARLMQAPGAEWEKNGLTAQPGASLPAGWVHLRSGMAQIQFYSGATVILEGPADVQLISPQEAYCARGKLRATIPHQACGFTIGSPKLKLVDLGTEFGLRVDESAQTEVHVFQGKVKVYGAGSGQAEASQRELTAGHGLRVDESGMAHVIVPEPSAFPTAQQLAHLAEQESRRRYQAWLAASERLRQDPRLLLYYTFQTDRPWDRILPDRVKGRQTPLDGTIVGCEWTNGRWPGKQALEFKSPGDRVRIYVPGEYDAITLMAWVCLDSLENRYNGLLVTDSWGDGYLQWQIRQDQMLYMSMERRPGEHDQLASPPIMGPAHLGRWTHLAAVYNRPAGTAQHYVNGRAVSVHGLLYPHKVQFRFAAIGNWGAPKPGHPNRICNLNGRMDEFALFKQALEAQEIRDLYEIGKPNP